jgi:hypothetical protein
MARAAIRSGPYPVSRSTTESTGQRITLRASLKTSVHGRSATVGSGGRDHLSKLDFSLLRDLQRVVDLDPKVSDGAFEFGVAE